MFSLILYFVFSILFSPSVLSIIIVVGNALECSSHT